MSEETRLRLGEGEVTEFERELLGSWDAEQPSDRARARVLAMVGITTAAATATGAGSGALAAKGAAAGSIAPKGGAIGAAALVKWLLVGAIGVGGAGAALVYARHANRDARVAPGVGASGASRASSAQELAPLTTGTTPAPLVSSGRSLASPLPIVPPATRATPDSPARAVSSSPARGVERSEKNPRPTDDALGEQVSALDRARHALASGDPASTLRQLDDYEARFPRSALVEEAEVLRVESLLASNDSAAAARVAGRFLAAHPGSPHAARIRALLGQAPAP
jgi:hypothetical protein